MRKEFNHKLYDDVAVWGRVICFILLIIVALLWGNEIVAMIGIEAAGFIGIVLQIVLVVTVPDKIAYWAAKRYGK
jgi:hypothetical protein